MWFIERLHGVKDVFIEVKEAQQRFSLYFFDGLKRTLRPITFSWEIQGTLSAPTQYSKNAYLLSFDDNDKQVLFCYIEQYYWAWLGYVEGIFRNVSTTVIDLEESDGIIECNEEMSITLKSLDKQWAYINSVRNGIEDLIILPKKTFESLGFVWGNNVNVRSGPGADYKQKKVLYQFQNGAVVNILDEREGWFRVKPRDTDSDKTEQWVKADFIKHIPPFSKNSKIKSAAQSQPNVQDSEQQGIELGARNVIQKATTMETYSTNYSNSHPDTASNWDKRAAIRAALIEQLERSGLSAMRADEELQRMGKDPLNSSQMPDSVADAIYDDLVK